MTCFWVVKKLFTSRKLDFDVMKRKWRLEGEKPCCSFLLVSPVETNKQTNKQRVTERGCSRKFMQRTRRLYLLLTRQQTHLFAGRPFNVKYITFRCTITSEWVHIGSFHPGVVTSTKASIFNHIFSFMMNLYTLTSCKHMHFILCGCLHLVIIGQLFITHSFGFVSGPGRQI